MNPGRIFVIDGGNLLSARVQDQLGAPHAVVGPILQFDSQQWLRLIQRAYELGRRDKAADIGAALEEP